MEGTVRPIQLGANQPPDRFYAGGAQIATFRRLSDVVPNTPEDWVASVTTLFGEQATGLTRLHHGGLLVDEIAADPEGWLGPEHVERWGSDACLLVKLLDAGQRLPVHFHPDQGFARTHLGLAHGKAEAWFMLRPADVHLGWVREVPADQLADWVKRQDVEAMLSAMHRVQLDAGDAVFVPPGCPHAIGQGAFLVEVQEPTDLSILLEWRDFAIDGPSAGHLGLGFETALRAVGSEAMSTARLDELIIRTGSAISVLPEEAEEYFRLERHRLGEVSLDAGYSVLVVESGSGILASPASGWDPLDLSGGDTVLVPHSAGPLLASGPATVLRCRPPIAGR